MSTANEDNPYGSGPAPAPAGGSARPDGDTPAPEAAVPYRPRHGLIAWLMQRTERDITSLLDRELRPTGLTFSQFSVLQALVELEPTSSARVARAMLVSPQAMVGLVATLERKKYIRRRTGVAAGRTLETTVTPAGRRAYDHAAALVERVDALLREACGPGGDEGLAAIMDDLTATATRSAPSDGD